MAVSPEIRNEVAKLRRKYPRMGTSTLLRIARHKVYPSDDAINFEHISDWQWPKMRKGQVVRDHFIVKIEVVYDQDPMTDGTFTDTWQPGAIRLPEWRGDRYRNDVVRFYVSAQGDLKDHLEHLNGHGGMSKHDAWLEARKYVLSDLKRDAEPEQYGVTCTAYLVTGDCTCGDCDMDLTTVDVEEDWFCDTVKFEEVGDASLWGLEVDDEAGETLDEAASDFVYENQLIEEAIEDYLEPKRMLAKAEADTYELLQELRKGGSTWMIE